MFRLAPLDTAAAMVGARPDATLDGALAVAPYTTPGIYGARAIVFRVGETGYGSYSYREWAIPLGDMLGMRTAEVLRRSPITRDGAVYAPPSRRQYRYVWQGVVHQFEEVNRGKAVFAAVSLEARLVRSADDSVVWVGSRRLERPIPSGTMTAIIEGLSELSTEVIQGLIDDVKKAAPVGLSPATPRP
jgi:hypothetical protein